jgi:hypothetical protein
MLALSSMGDLERTAPTTSRFTFLYKMIQATGLELLEPCDLLSGLIRARSARPKHVVMTSRRSCPDLRIVCRWPAILSSRFMSMLRAHNSAASVLYAHFTTLTEFIKGQGLWYIEGWSTRTMNAICAGVDMLGWNGRSDRSHSSKRSSFQCSVWMGRSDETKCHSSGMMTRK